ncbi:glycoside hydrolase family 3 protein [Tuber brumale]|nr:glycoside hydrolase family 3 protein [Tuber brumale]
MTLGEKVGQVMQGDISYWLNLTDGSFNRSGLVDNMSYKAGQFPVGHPIPWAQRYLVEEARLGIPGLVRSEGIHGFSVGNATIFNSPIGYTCASDPDLIEKIAKMITRESIALGVNHLFAPVLNLSRKPRLSRAEEMLGEDPYLSGELGYMFVRGRQKNGVAATIKHFAGFGTPEQGLNAAPIHGGEREMRRTYLPAFKRSILDPDVWSVISAYHSCVTPRATLQLKVGTYDDIPVVADYHLLTEVLRGEWGFKYGITLLPMNGRWNLQPPAIPGLLQDGTLEQNVLRTAVSRTLRSKFTMGPSENPFSAAPQEQWNNLILSEEPVKLNNGVLPIDREKVESIAVLGPMVHGFMNYGDCVVYLSQYRGIPFKDTSTTATYAQGCDFPEAIVAAKAAEAAVKEPWRGFNAAVGEHVDLHNLNPVGAQADLVRENLAVNNYTIVVSSSGKPITKPWISTSAAALVQQFYPSEEGGNALADLLFGKYCTSPSYYGYPKGGRSNSPGQVYENEAMVFRHQYVLSWSLPLYPFGYVKSYSTFQFSDVTIDKVNITALETVTPLLKIGNNSPRDGTEVMQLYVTDRIASVIFLHAGEQKIMCIPIENRWVVEKGKFVIAVGDSAEVLNRGLCFG